MAENGEEKLIAVARHIAKTLGHTDTMATDILNIFSNFDGRLRENLSRDTAEQTLNSLHRKLSPYFSDDAPIWSDSTAAASFLHSVDRLIAVAREWTPLSDDDQTLSSRAEGLLRQSMSRLKDEFKTLAQHGGDETVEDLREIAKRMAAAGHVEECSLVYVTCRREFLQENLSILGLQKSLTTHEVQRMQWSQLEDEIDQWIAAIKAAFTIVFPNEQHLSDRIFSGLSDHPFVEEICRGSAVQLLSFADSLATGSRSPESLFKLLDVYEVVRDLITKFELLFSDHSLKDEVVYTGERLRDIIKGIFVELEDLIRRDPAKAVVPGGGLHPITRYVTNYLCAACRSHQILEHIFEENNVVDANLDYNGSSSLAVRVTWLMELLENNLEEKSNVYREPALCAVFMMNNMRYIVQKAKGSEMGSVLGPDWIRERMAKIRRYHISYQRCSWAKVLGVLRIDSDSSMSPDRASKSLREKLKLFNSYFEEMCRIQSCWVIFDEQLREELRVSVVGTVSPAYRNFVWRVKANPEIGKHGERYVRLSVEDVEARIAGLFEGSSGRR